MTVNEDNTLQNNKKIIGQNSVFDFFYHDSLRIASFLAQFNKIGLLTGLTQGESSVKNSKRSKKIGVGADLPIIGGGKLEFEVGPDEAGSSNSQHSYDPFWANARKFIDVVTERNLINEDITNCSLGQFVFAKGFLSIKDITMLKEAWKFPSVRKLMQAGASTGKKKSLMSKAEKEAQKAHDDTMNTLLDLLQIFPHSVHAQMITSDEDSPNMIWCTLKEEHLVIPAADIAMTYGKMMTGEWSIIGILSAYPDYEMPNFDQVTAANETSGLMESALGELTKTLGPVIRFAMGRPPAAHALTPLLIFREIKQ
jgi:hypothetical protein